MTQQLATCVFCKIIRNEEPGEKIYEDDDVTCIKDINPASTHHYLILPNKHIRNAKTLQPEDSELFDKIVATVDTITEKLGLDPASTRTGFHWPPFNTVDHLHLHFISPIEKMNSIKKMMFNPNSFWFVSFRLLPSACGSEMKIYGAFGVIAGIGIFITGFDKDYMFIEN